MSTQVFEPDFSYLQTGGPSSLEEYGRFQQHLALLEDHRRLALYLDAIRAAPLGENVVDVGAGTGVLSLMALKCGYKHAYLIEPSQKIGAYARHLAEINGVSDKVTILQAKLEDLPANALPDHIDLVVSETISSIIFGFGCWDRFADLTRRVRLNENVIPASGALFASLAFDDYATHGEHHGGLKLLKEAGIHVDLFRRTFRSGGNVYDKSRIREALKLGRLIPSQIADFDMFRDGVVQLGNTTLTSSTTRKAKGIVLFWIIKLSCQPSVELMTSLDSELISWYPVFVPFKSDVHLQIGENLPIEISLNAIDSPYKYAIQFKSAGSPITEMLYW